MKIFTLFILLIFTLIACNEEKKPTAVDNVVEVGQVKDATYDGAEVEEASSASTQDTFAAESADNDEASEDDSTAHDSINFEKYAVEVQKVVQKAPLDFSSYPDAKFFRTRIIDGYKSNEIDFGGHYIGTIFGCGASCIMGFMVDVRDGKVYDLPLGEQNMCMWDLGKAISNPDSRLFISSICKKDEESQTPYYIAYVWNEENKVFEIVSTDEFIIKN
ncbi:hypothetical protein [Flavobacterium tegetincola]|uniref:hypothetical protein n=1 Tax=Flavobacterium tegetincola TaxID=150172 RepID=UPI00041EF022|nr:hypothetical protein [Flavobacterium tegetincola]